ncbi:MAG TPA: NAD-dependent deacylase [bacterium]|nr:NAD-dependent deacylase [bacterium]
MECSEVAGIIKNSRRTVAFTGAGISVESGIPPFRGENGLWNKYNPKYLDINYFLNEPEQCWKIIKEIFYDYFGRAKPNAAHITLAEMEKQGYLKALITQNIDNLHQEAGSRNVYEFHGASHTLLCMSCFKKYSVNEDILGQLPPRCPECGGLLKPDFVFFGEPIPADVSRASFKEAEDSDVFIVIGTTGEVMPASLLAYTAKQRGAVLIEVNLTESKYTNEVTDYFLQGKATEIMEQLAADLGMADSGAAYK